MKHLFLLILAILLYDPVTAQSSVQEVVTLINLLSKHSDINEAQQILSNDFCRSGWDEYSFCKGYASYHSDLRSSRLHAHVADYYEDELFFTDWAITLHLGGYKRKFRSDQEIKKRLEVDFEALKMELSKYYTAIEKDFRENGDMPEFEKVIFISEDQVKIKLHKFRGGCFGRASIEIEILKHLKPLSSYPDN